MAHARANPTVKGEGFRSGGSGRKRPRRPRRALARALGLRGLSDQGASMDWLELWSVLWICVVEGVLVVRFK